MNIKSIQKTLRVKLLYLQILHVISKPGIYIEILYLLLSTVSGGEYHRQ